MQGGRLDRRRERFVISAETVERCFMLSICCAAAQALPLARRGSATLVPKNAASASGVIGATGFDGSARPGPRYGMILAGAQLPGDIGKHGFGIGRA